jgi:hypothetical protein
MKTIQSVTVWVNGLEQEATVLSATASNDNLLNSASFTYQLFKATGYDPAMGNSLIALTSGYLTMTGEAYDNWETNEYAYNWVAAQLNLTITGDYVPQVFPQPEPTPEPITEPTRTLPESEIEE